MFSSSIKSSYTTEQVTLLLHESQLSHTNVEEKEYLIQTGQKHYSEMISLERPPTPEHQAFFELALQQGKRRVAKEVYQLALTLHQLYGEKPIVLVSLVRAGLPIGVLLKQILESFNRPVFHYGVSIIRDRGLDEVAYQHIRDRHSFSEIVFVDGWTGKGAITGELSRSVSNDADYDGVVRLVTLADVAGVAWLSASFDDWLIPSGILGSTVSGLISRSVYQANKVHQSMYYADLQPFDSSQYFINIILEELNLLLLENKPIQSLNLLQKNILQAQNQQAKQVILGIEQKFSVTKINRIKPSLAEATRAVMRRQPEVVFIRSLADNDVQLLLHLAKQFSVKIEEMGELISPYRAITLLKKRD